MIFSSTLFIFYFFPFFLLIYYLAEVRYKNDIALLASIFFFSWGAPLFIYVVLGSIIIDFFLIQWMNQTEGQKRKVLLSISIVFNLGLLLYFKYFNFFVSNINDVLTSWNLAPPIQWANIALPVGISFFTFKKLSYSIDVFRKTHLPFVKLRQYALFIILFPELVAGPIVRFNDIANQIIDRRSEENINNKLMGFFRFIIGLAKKVLIANVLGKEVDYLFSLPIETISTSYAWLGIIAYSFQIYYDFSGYSDMAIGIARMIGFKFPENFDNPYISQNITEFWRRWHITLGKWMRDYLYIPLGGNKVSAKRVYFNLWVVFLLSGLWHGASWNFVIWGAYHGLFLIMDRLFLLKVYSKIGTFASIIITYVIVIVGWVFFRSEELSDATSYLSRMFSFSFHSASPFFGVKFYLILSIGIFFAFSGITSLGHRIQQKFLNAEYSSFALIMMSLITFLALFISECSINSSGFNPFIYFRF